jgi:hypothetical protein
VFSARRKYDNSTKFQLAQSIYVKHNFESTKTKIMQLQDAFSIPKIFIGLDIHKKKLDSFYPNRFIFSQDLFDAF